MRNVMKGLCGILFGFAVVLGLIPLLGMPVHAEENVLKIDNVYVNTDASGNGWSYDTQTNH